MLFRSHGIPHTITHNENAILVELEDVNGLADSILDLLENKERCANLGLAGYELVQNICNAGEMVRNTLKLYQEVIDKKS